MSNREVIRKIKELEIEGRFNEHINPIDESICIPVDENFHYLKKPFFKKIRYFFEKIFIVKPFIFYINKVVTKSRVVGKEKLKGIKNAIIVCNHVYLFDCLVITKAVRPHKLYITAATFNNRKGFLGQMMRVGNMMPFGGTHQAIRNFNEAIKHHLTHNKYVMFYPEEAMWWMYEKPRPHKNGAYHYAIKHNVPVIPIYITFEDTGKLDNECLAVKKFVVNIMDPVYQDENKDKASNMEYMKKTIENMYKEKYEEFYKKELVYDKVD